MAYALGIRVHETVRMHAFACTCVLFIHTYICVYFYIIVCAPDTIRIVAGSEAGQDLTCRGRENHR